MTADISSKDVEASKDVEKDVESVDEETEYPSWKRVALIMMAIYISVFLIALDKLIIVTAIPQITNTFSSLSDIGWYGSAYMLTLCSFQLFWGKLYKLATTKSLPLPLSSPKTVLLLAITVFEIGSTICGAAPSSPAFIIGRAIAGLGASGIMNGTIVVMFSILPLRKRPVYQGFVGAMFGIASIVGPLLGGAFTEKVSWRWCFYINLPLGGLAMAVLIVVLPGKTTAKKATDDKTTDKATALEHFLMFDPAGTLLFIISIICLLLALQWGGATYAWSNWRIILLLILFPVLLIAFFAIQVRYPKYATLPLRILKQRSVACAFWYMWWVQSAMLVIAYYIPLFFQAIKNFTPLDSGLATLPLLLSLVIASIIAGGLVQRLGVPAPFMLISVTLATIGAGMISTWPVNVHSSEWIGYQVLLGFGIGIGMQMPSLVVQIVLPKPDQSTGVALMFLAQNAGGAVFLSVAQNVFTDQLAKNIQGIPGLNIGKAAIAKLGATEIKNLVSKALLPTLLEGYRLAIRDLFWMGTGLVAIAIFGAALVEWRSLKKPEENSKDGAAVEEKTTESSV